MKKSIYVYACLLLMILFGCVFNQAWPDDMLSRDQAITILMEQVINPSNNKQTLMVFGPQNLLTQGDIVEPCFPSKDPHMINIHNINSPTWFFYVDDLPNAGFVHPTRFVYIDAKKVNPTIGDGIEIEYQKWNPKISGESVYENTYKGDTHADWIYGTVPLTVPIMPTGRPF